MLRKLPALDIEGPPLADPKQWHVKVDGLVKGPKTYTMDDIGRSTRWSPPCLSSA